MKADLAGRLPPAYQAAEGLWVYATVTEVLEAAADAPEGTGGDAGMGAGAAQYKVAVGAGEEKEVPAAMLGRFGPRQAGG